MMKHFQMCILEILITAHLHHHTCILKYITFALGEISAPSAYLTVVYAKCSLQERRLLWEDLISFSASISVPWIVGGDFNAIIGQHEKQGGDPPRRTSMTDLKDFIDLSWMLVSRVIPFIGSNPKGKSFSGNHFTIFEAAIQATSIYFISYDRERTLRLKHGLLILCSLLT